MAWDDEMTTDPITFFKHCHPTKNLFCFDIPHTCPLCEQPIKSFVVPPCLMPSPLNCTNSIKAYSVVIKPTHGSFVRYQIFRFLSFFFFNKVFSVSINWKIEKCLNFVIFFSIRLLERLPTPVKTSLKSIYPYNR